jgi:hypothetical protein
MMGENEAHSLGLVLTSFKLTRPQTARAERRALEGRIGDHDARSLWRQPVLDPRGGHQSLSRAGETLPRIKDSHERRKINAIKTGGKADADYDYSGRSPNSCGWEKSQINFPERKRL